MATETLEPPAPEVSAPALEPTLPESVKAALPKGSLESEVDKFFPKPVQRVVPKEAPPVVVENHEVKAPEAPKVETVADKLAAKAEKPKVKAEVTPEPPKAPEIKHPEDDLALDAKSSTAARENFAKLKGITKGVRDELIKKDREAQELRTKLEAASKAPTTEQLTELEKLRSESKSLSDQLLLKDTANHPTFKAQYIAPRDAAVATAKELLEANGKTDTDVNKLLNLPRGELGKAINEIVKDLPDLDRQEVVQSVHQAWKVQQAGNEALKNAAQTSAAIHQKTESEHKQIFTRRWETVTSGNAPAKLEVPVDATPEIRADYEAFNTDAEQLQARAEAIALKPLTEDQVAEHAIKSSAYDFHLKHVQPRLLSAIDERNTTIARLTKELEGFRSRNPNRQITPTPQASAEAKIGAKTIEELADEKFGASQ